MSELVKKIKEQITAALKAKDDVTKNVLRTVLGEVGSIEMSANQAGKPISDEQVCKVIRKVQQANTETLQHLRASVEGKPLLTEPTAQAALLEKENQILESFLPKLLTLDEIKAKLSGLAEIKEAKNAGQAVGLAMKHLKAAGDAVDGNDVKKAVEELRM
jgi:uncharacterized protein YqeY